MKKLLRIMMTAMLLAFAGVASAYVRVDFETGEFNQYPVINNGTYPWVVTNSYYSSDYNVYRMMSGNQGVNNSTSTIEITYNYPNAGMMFFTAYCKPSSGDVCKFYIDGVLWRQAVDFSPGVHRWNRCLVLQPAMVLGLSWHSRLVVFLFVLVRLPGAGSPHDFRHPLDLQR